MCNTGLGVLLQSFICTALICSGVNTEFTFYKSNIHNHTIPEFQILNHFRSHNLHCIVLNICSHIFYFNYLHIYCIIYGFTKHTFDISTSIVLSLYVWRPICIQNRTQTIISPRDQ